ncbi:MAG: Lrp/AsnC family transcriptional regulator [Deltaproteobacteria bacterium]|jgi:DNA-binding Lrp family transcriptional regulator|nr:Lrp/AsnC family transcriptional regulator [Deltaproteobacteria bacterium]
MDNARKDASVAPALNGLEGLDRVDRLILNRLQDNFPLNPRPYARLAVELNEKRGLNLTEAEVIERIESLKALKFVRRVGAIFNHDRLGFRSTLGAAKVPAEKIDLFVQLVSSSPWVTHNYLRNDDLNIWFTFCYNNIQQLNNFFDYLKSKTGIHEIYEMPSIKVYKIKAIFTLPE